MIKKIKNIAAKILERDFDYVFEAISWRMPDWLFYYFHTLLAKNDNPKLFSRRLSDCTIKFISESDIDLLEKNGFPRELTESRIEAGDKSVIIFKGDEILSIIWAADGKRHLKLSGIDFDPGEEGVFIYGGYTKESARLRGLHPIAFTRIYTSYSDNGRTDAYTTISATNKYSIQIHERLNFGFIGESFLVTLLGINFCFVKKWPYNVPKLRISLKKNPQKLPWV